MSSANVQAIHALDEFRGALAKYDGAAQSALSAAAQEIQRTNDWLGERKQHWQTQATYWQAQVRQLESKVRQLEDRIHQQTRIVESANAALTRCQSSGSRDKDGHYHPPDCSRYADQVEQATRALGESKRMCSQAKQQLAEAQRQLAQAESELQNVQQWTNRVQQANSEYQRVAQQLNATLSSELAKASALLANSADILQSYTDISASTSTRLSITEPSPTASTEDTTPNISVSGGHPELSHSPEVERRPESIVRETYRPGRQKE